MSRGNFWVAVLLLTSFLLPAGALAVESQRGFVLFDFESEASAGQIEAAESRAAVSEGKLRIETGYQDRITRIALKPGAGKWDLSPYQYVTAEITNTSKIPITISLSVENPDASYNGSIDRSVNCNTGTLRLSGGKSGILKVPFFRNPYSDKNLRFIGMRGGPPIKGILDPANVVSLGISLDAPRQKRSFEVDNIIAGGSYDASGETGDKPSFFPMIDEFGQYIHKEWPGKTHSVEELIAWGKEEEEDLAAHPGPDDWDKYGGWAGGPKLEATGFFRAAKYKDKWWLVDPEGRLFWSHGIDCVRTETATPITDREHYFKNLPAEDGEFAGFYSNGSFAARGYYQDKAFYKTFDFAGANLLRKYGDSWQEQRSSMSHRQLKSWGMNTIGNWSSEAVYLMRKTPYVCAIHYRSKKVAGSEGYWGKFPDVFDADFRHSLRQRLYREKNTTAGDAWFIGYFVDNELGWGDDTSLGTAALASAADQAAKKVFIEDLKAKYLTIEKLNTSWSADYDSWDDLLESRKAPDKKRAAPDLKEFYTKFADEYFRICREETKRVAPDNLYLGCRFAWQTESAVRAAAKYCDVISFNRYEQKVGRFHLPEGIDKPVIVGEFHFGALDRGLFHPGLGKVQDQNERAAQYKNYLEGALGNPIIVGTHWFQYKDQATTGRGDGENYQIGFLDICDKPYAETIEACRQVGYRMYEYRLGL